MAYKLTDVLIRKAREKEDRYKLADGGGLYVLVTPAGGKLWRYDYKSPDGKRQTLAIGKYPDISLQEAREQHQEARKLLAHGTDPMTVRKAQKAAGQERAANSFEVVAREWHTKHSKTLSVGYSKDVLSRMEKWIFPYIGGRPIADLKTPELLSVCRRAEDAGKIDTAHDVKRYISQVTQYAVLTGRIEHDPALPLRGALQPVSPKHFASITEPAKVAELLRAIDNYTGGPIVRAALHLAPMVFVRPWELRTARWADIDLDEARWEFVYLKQRAHKADKDRLIVPLPRQALAILKDLYPLTGNSKYVFPGVRSGRPISDGTINRALQSMGYDTKTDITGHGFRAMARTMLAERLRKPPDVIERQLSHGTREELGEAYDRTQYLDERKTMMQEWADYLDKLKAGQIAGVVPFPAAG